MSMFDDLKRMAAEIAALPEPLAYIVLDHARSPSLPPGERRDARGRRYVLCSPAVLDGMTHQKYGGANVLGSDMVARGWGVPLYRCEDMPAGWPDGDAAP